MSDAGGVTIRESGDHEAAFALGRGAGLEIGDSPSPPLVLWGAYDGSRLVGIVSLDHDCGLPIVRHVAVHALYRRRGLGRRLLAVAEAEAQRRGADRLWVTARTPALFLAAGYETVADGAERDALLRDCDGCPQRSATCRPQALSKRLASASQASSERPPS